MMKRINRQRILTAVVLLASLPTPASAQGTIADYRRAERFLPATLRKLAYDGQVSPNWLERSSRFWYRKDSPGNKEFWLVDAAQGTRLSAFDHERLAASLSRVAGKSYAARELPFDAITYTDKGAALQFVVEGRRWTCDLATYECTAAAPEPSRRAQLDVPSPDGKLTAFVKDHNLFLRVVATGEEVQLSRDGELFYDYATPLPSPTLMVEQKTEQVAQRASVFWSPDSKRLVTFVMDQRGFPRLTMVQSAPPDSFRPRGYHYAYPLPVDDKLPMAIPVIFDVEGRRQVPSEMKPIPMFYYGSPGFFWFRDSKRFFYRDTERAHKSIRLLEVDAATGKARPILEERAETMINSSVLQTRFINEQSEVLWSSERDGWNHLYLYDAKGGALKNQITKGEWVIRGIENVDEAGRRLYFTAGGREPGRDPYLRHLYRVNLDGSDLKLLTPEDADHTVAFSPDGKFFVDSYSRADLPTVSVVRRAEDGGVAMELEKADVSRLTAMGWKYPEPFRAKGRDGKTDVYGLIWRPTNFDPAKKYPVVEQIYSGPHGAFVPKTFAAYRNHSQAMAELGFICVFIDGMGTALRSKAFHNVSYRNLGDGGLEDHIAALRQMAARYPYMDLSRVGVFGHSAGGYDSTHAILTHPEFYKVAVSSAGNHDHRMDKAWWNESWMSYPADKHYTEQSNYTLAKNLRGRLLIAHGDIDENVPVAATIKLVDALIAANKDFDFILMPNRTHGFGNDPYFMRKRWDFFVRHLHGVEPPSGYRIGEGEPPPPARPTPARS